MEINTSIAIFMILFMTLLLIVWWASRPTPAAPTTLKPPVTRYLALTDTDAESEAVLQLGDIVEIKIHEPLNPNYLIKEIKTDMQEISRSVESGNAVGSGRTHVYKFHPSALGKQFVSVVRNDRAFDFAFNVVTI